MLNNMNTDLVNVVELSSSNTLREWKFVPVKGSPLSQGKFLYS